MLNARGASVDRTGGGSVVEVYPAAALMRWGLPHRGYKQTKGLDTLSALVDGVKATAPWLDLGDYEQLCRSHDDALDAVVAALSARAAACGDVEPVPPTDRHSAAVEGWIALPTVALATLIR